MAKSKGYYFMGVGDFPILIPCAALFHLPWIGRLKKLVSIVLADLRVCLV